MSKSLFAATLVCVVATACERGSETPQARVAQNEFHAWHPEAVSSATVRKAVGEDIAAGGSCEFFSVHITPLPNAGRICTVPCSSDEGCPVRWVCTELEGAGLCIPPSDWAPASVMPRNGVMPSRVESTSGGEP